LKIATGSMTVTAAPVGAAITVMELTGDAILAFKVALTAAATIVILALTALTVRHLSELLRIRYEGRALLRVTKAAVCGPQNSPQEAAAKRADARAYAKDHNWNDPTTVEQVMKAARVTEPGENL
jgi:hypothetical protein